MPQPVLRDYGNIEHRDAVLAYDREELLLDERGKPVTRWDGETMKISPVTGEGVPDENARVPVYRYLNPRRAQWPKADFIIGNPPYIGLRQSRNPLGEGYLEALRISYPEVPENSDLVMFWWLQAATIVRDGFARRFGLITTNSIAQPFGRRLTSMFLDGPRPFGLVFAIPDHPWVDSSDGADVRIAMTVGSAQRAPGTLLRVVREELDAEGVAQPEFSSATGMIHADLSVGVDLIAADALLANSSLCSVGYQLGGKGFLLPSKEREELQRGYPEEARFVYPLMSARDLTQTPRGLYAIDVSELKLEELKGRPKIYQLLSNRVRPERVQNARASYRERWWVYGETRPTFRSASKGLRRFIVTPITAKHRFFVFVELGTIADSTTVMVASDDAASLGTLSSHVHALWALRSGGRMGVGNDPRYLKATCFDPFPFPDWSDAQTQHIRALGEALDAHRKRQQARHPSLTITGIYNVLEKLRSGEPLDEKERGIHEQGLVSVLKRIHDDLDAAVFEAYGWPSTLTDEEILERLVALNHERAEEEKRGIIRWLRPEFQNPQGTKTATQASLAEAGLETVERLKVEKGKKATKLSWPKDLPARVLAARDLLAELGEATADDFPRRFKGVRSDKAEKLLESLAAVGVAIETTAGPGAQRTWRLVR